MIAIVCGGRDYHLTPADRDIMDALPITMVFHGAAPGADTGAAEWAASQDESWPGPVEVRPFPANWRLYKKQAGPIRNAAMLRAAQEEAKARGQILIVVAFPGGRGTADMLRKARSAFVPCLFVPAGYGRRDS